VSPKTRSKILAAALAIAVWRYEQITDALAIPSADIRGSALRALAKAPVVWPNGQMKRISLATLYRWIKLFNAGGLDALRPVRRKDSGKVRRPLPRDVLRKAMSLLADDPEMTFTFLLALLRADPELRLEVRQISLSRSTLQRQLAADPGYRRLKRARKLGRRRLRFVGRYVHDVWHYPD